MVNLFKLLKGGIKNMARTAEIGKNEVEESEKETTEETVESSQENPVSGQEIIDMANGHLARASQLLELLKTLKAN